MSSDVPDVTNFGLNPQEAARNNELRRARVVIPELELEPRGARRSSRTLEELQELAAAVVMVVQELADQGRNQLAADVAKVFTEAALELALEDELEPPTNTEED